MAVVKRVDGETLWLKKYRYVMQLAESKQAGPKYRADLEKDIMNELGRLRANARTIMSGRTFKVTGTNTLYVLPNGHKVLYFSDEAGLNNTVYYEFEEDCHARLYRRWMNLSYEERNKDNFIVLKRGNMKQTVTPKPIKKKSLK